MLNPIVQFFKKSYLYVNNVIIAKYIDSRFWKFDNYGIRDFRKEYALIKNDLKRFHPEVNPEGDFESKDIFAKHLIDIQSQYMYVFDIPCVLEPKFFWLINKRNNRILRFSKLGTFDPWGPNTGSFPSFLNYFLFSKRIKTPCAIPITNYMWFNYYHFFFDVLSQVVQLRRYGVSPSVPIVAPYDSQFVKFVNEFFEISNLFNSRKIIYLKKNEMLEITNESIVVRDSYMNHETIDEILNSIDYSLIEDLNDVPKKIFLTRSSSRRRGLINIGQIEEIALKNGYAIVDTDGWSLKKQIAFFSKVEIIIGIHGAGLTNIMFGKNSIKKVFEIMPGDLNPGFYMHLSWAMNYEYTKIFGGKREVNQNFYLDPFHFQTSISSSFN